MCPEDLGPVPNGLFLAKKNGGDPQPLTNESWDDPPSVEDLKRKGGNSLVVSEMLASMNFFLRQGRLSQKVVFTQAGFMNRYTEKIQIYIYIYIYICVLCIYIYTLV